jgi:hypothetical protein
MLHINYKGGKARDIDLTNAVRRALLPAPIGGRTNTRPNLSTAWI